MVLDRMCVCVCVCVIQNQLLEVADPVMIETGLYDSTGTKEVVLPAIHSVQETHHDAVISRLVSPSKPSFATYTPTGVRD
jgi:hypothetical protein